MENTAFQNISLENIPAYKYEGYYWYSDQQSPHVILQEPINLGWFTILPFVVEANFYAKDEKISIRVLNIDGVYKVTLVDLNRADRNTEYRNYVAHDIPQANYYSMAEGWTAVKEDELLEGMSTLVPSWSAFVGFIHA